MNARFWQDRLGSRIPLQVSTAPERHNDDVQGAIVRPECAARITRRSPIIIAFGAILGLGAILTLAWIGLLGWLVFEFVHKML